MGNFHPRGDIVVFQGQITVVGHHIDRALYHQAQGFVDVFHTRRTGRLVFGIDGKQAARLADGHVFKQRLGQVEFEIGPGFFQHQGDIVQIGFAQTVERKLAVGMDFPLRQGEIECADFDNRIAGKQTRSLVARGMEQGLLNFVLAHVFRSDFRHCPLDRQQGFRFQMFCRDIDVQRAVVFIAVDQAVETEAAFGIRPAALFVHARVELQLADGDFRRRHGAGGVDERADLQIGYQIHQFVQFDVVIDAFLPLERQFVQFETAAADGQLARAVVGIAADLQVFHPDVALVGKLDVQQRGLVIAFKAGPSGGVGSFPAQAFPIQGDARQFLIIKRGYGQVQTTAAAQTDGIGQRYRHLFAEKAFQHFPRLGAVAEFAFNPCGGRLQAVGKRAVFDMIDDGNRLGQHGFQIIGQIIARIVQQRRLQPDFQSFRRFEPAALVTARFDGEETVFLQQAVLVCQHLLGLPAEIIRRTSEKQGTRSHHARKCGNQLFLHRISQRLEFKAASIASFTLFVFSDGLLPHEKRRFPPHVIRYNNHLHERSDNMYDYQSDATKFLNEYIEKHPEEAERRLKNRELLWDVELKAEEQAAFAAAKVAKKPYTYYSYDD